MKLRDYQMIRVIGNRGYETKLFNITANNSPALVTSRSELLELSRLVETWKVTTLSGVETEKTISFRPVGFHCNGYHGYGNVVDAIIHDIHRDEIAFVTTENNNKAEMLLFRFVTEIEDRMIVTEVGTPFFYDVLYSNMKNIGRLCVNTLLDSNYGSYYHLTRCRVGNFFAGDLMHIESTRLYAKALKAIHSHYNFAEIPYNLQEYAMEQLLLNTKVQMKVNDGEWTTVGTEAPLEPSRFGAPTMTFPIAV